MIAYPSGCDQWYNAQRAVEAGIAVKANPKMEGLDSTVIDMLKNDAIKARSIQLASEVNIFATDEIILEQADEVAGSDDSETASLSSSACDESPINW